MIICINSDDSKIIVKLNGKKVKLQNKRVFFVNLIIYDTRITDKNNTICGRKHFVRKLKFPKKMELNVPHLIMKEKSRYAIFVSIKENDKLIWLTEKPTFIQRKKRRYNLCLFNIGM